MIALGWGSSEQRDSRLPAFEHHRLDASDQQVALWQSKAQMERTTSDVGHRCHATAWRDATRWRLRLRTGHRHRPHVLQIHRWQQLGGGRIQSCAPCCASRRRVPDDRHGPRRNTRQHRIQDQRRDYGVHIGWRWRLQVQRPVVAAQPAPKHSVLVQLRQVLPCYRFLLQRLRWATALATIPVAYLRERGSTGRCPSPFRVTRNFSLPLLFTQREIWSVVLGKIFEIVVNRCQILGQKYRKFDFKIEFCGAPTPVRIACNASRSPSWIGATENAEVKNAIR